MTSEQIQAGTNAATNHGSKANNMNETSTGKNLVDLNCFKCISLGVTNDNNGNRVWYCANGGVCEPCTHNGTLFERTIKNTPQNENRIRGVQ